MRYIYTCPVCMIAEENLSTRSAAEYFRSEHRLLAHRGSRPIGDRITEPEGDYALNGKTIVLTALVLLILWAARSCGLT